MNRPEQEHSDNLRPPNTSPSATSRRKFLLRLAMTGAAFTIGARLSPFATVSAEPTASTDLNDPLTGLPVTLRINGRNHALNLDPRSTLLDTLRERLHLCGAKKGCDHGQCGACTVLVNGQRVLACLSLAVAHEGDEITTVEGLANGTELHPVQTAFIEQDGFQCGYCTPGQICSAVALLKENHANSDGEIREWMSGNLCRCGAYPNIVAAVKQAKGKLSS